MGMAPVAVGGPVALEHNAFGQTTVRTGNQVAMKTEAEMTHAI